MAEFALPLAFAAVFWWVSTGVILWLDGMPRRTFSVSFAAMSVIGLGSLVAFHVASRHPSPLGAYAAFSAALGVWAWHEMSFLMGYITGPRRAPLGAGARGWTRFREAAATLIHHEAALAITGLAVAALAWGAPNQTGALAFLVLFVMRLSAKLNIFLGVPNFSDDFLPEHLSYLKSYFRRRAFNALMPVSLVGSVAGSFALASAAMAADPGSGARTGALLVMALLALAVLEHLFMLVPVADSALWRWAFPAPNSPAAVAAVAASSPASPPPSGAQATHRPVVRRPRPDEEFTNDNAPSKAPQETTPGRLP